MGGVCIVGGGGGGGGSPGGDLVPTTPGCVWSKVKDMGLFLGLKGVRMSENISLKMCVKFAVTRHV